MSHTPGPWEADLDSWGSVFAPERETSLPKWWIADIRDHGRFELDGEDDANARLIAAAPDLLRLAEDALWELEQAAKEYEDGCEDCFQPTRKNLRAIIAAAKGEA